MQWIDSVGTDKVGIVLSAKMGNTSLRELRYFDTDPDGIPHTAGERIGNTDRKYRAGENIPRVIEVNQWEASKIYVVLLRDPFERWKSGYHEELFHAWTGLAFETVRLGSKEFDFSKDKYRELLIGFLKNHQIYDNDNMDEYIMVGEHYLGNMHDINNNLAWMWSDDASFWKYYPSRATPVGLLEFSHEFNIYFLDLKNLSNPKFLEWLQEKDEIWKAVKEIPHVYKRSGYLTRDHIHIFWDKYKRGEIFQDRTLVSPFYDILPDEKNLVSIFGSLRNWAHEIQSNIYYIKNKHKRYLRF